jgi:hypothetical protein
MYIYFVGCNVGCNKRFFIFFSHTLSQYYYHVAPVSSLILTSMRSCNGHAPPIIQEGRGTLLSIKYDLLTCILLCNINSVQMGG